MNLNSLNVVDEVHKLLTTTTAADLPPDAIRHLLLGKLSDIDTNKVDGVIKKMRECGLSFGWVSLDNTQPPYCLIDLQHNQTRIIPPPFLYLQTPNLAALAATTGLYIQLLNDKEDTLWTAKYRITLDDDGDPCYNGVKLITPEALHNTSPTKH